MSPDDLIDFTPELLSQAREILEQYDYGPLYMPPSERGTLNMPGWAGGASWPGGAFDPESGFLYVPSFTNPVSMTLKKPDRSRSSFDYIGSIETTVPGPHGLPLVKPPYSRLTAYDMNKGEIAWVVPIGDGPRRHPALRDLDLPALGSGTRNHVLATKTLLFVASGDARYGGTEARRIELVFESVDELAGGSDEAEALAARRAAAAATDWAYEASVLRVLDKSSGETLWEMKLDLPVRGSPMTYLHGGVKYLVIAVGGRGRPQELVALRLAEV